MNKFLFNFTFLLIFSTNFAQVAIGTTTPDDGSAFQIDSQVGAFVMPRMTQSELENIPTPLEGAMAYNTTTQSLFTFNGSEWIRLVKEVATLPTIVLNRAGSTSAFNLQLGTNTYQPLPINSSHIQTNNPNFYTVSNGSTSDLNGRITVLQDGVYNITAGVSTSNLPSGQTKYVLGIYLNGTGGSNLIGYLSRGSVNLPNVDHWGTSGQFSYSFSANDVIHFRYVLNGTGTVTGSFINVGITKVN